MCPACGSASKLLSKTRSDGVPAKRRFEREVQAFGDRQYLAQRGQRDVVGGEARLPGLVDRVRHRLAVGVRQVRQRRVQIGPAVVHDTGQTCQPILEHDDLLLAVAQCADEDLQVLDDVDDVAALAKLFSIAFEDVGKLAP